MTETYSPREHNVEAAHSVALSLNNLIDARVVNTTNVSTASAAKMDEFLVRYTEHIHSGNFTPLHKLKLATLFGSPGQAEPSPVEPRGEQVVELMRNVYERYAEKDPELQGFLLFGSRMDPEKNPRDDQPFEPTYDEPSGGRSDIDTIAVMDTNDAWKITDTAPVHANFEKVKQKLYPNMKTILGRSSIEMASIWYDELTGKMVQFEFPVWGWNPKAVRYVGHLHIPYYFSPTGEDIDLNEKQVNQMIQNYLASDAIQALRKQELDKARDLIVQ